MPKRIQRKRTKGWRKPEGAIIVDRTSRWGNPYKVGQDGAVVGEVTIFGSLTPAAAVWAFEHALYWGLLPFTVEDARRELTGKDLICWCGLDQPCHADVLRRIGSRVGGVRTLAEMRKGYSPAIREAS